MSPWLRSCLSYTVVAILSLAAGIGTAQWLYQPGHSSDPNLVGVPDYRPDFTLQDLTGRSRAISEWDGKVILLNFWATWCPPCRKEIPEFIELRQELDPYSFEVIGVAIDQATPTQDFIDGFGVQYPNLLADTNGIDIMRAYGNTLGTLPYTVIIDQNQNIVKVFRKEIHRADAKAVIYPLLGIESAKPAI